MSDRENLDTLVEGLYQIVLELRKTDKHASSDDKLVEMGRKESADEIMVLLRGME